MPQKNSHLTPEILKMHAAGATYRQITEALEVSRNQVVYWCSPKGREQRIGEAARRHERRRAAGIKTIKPRLPSAEKAARKAERAERMAERRKASVGIRRAQRAANRARQSGKAFTLTEADIMALAQQTHCAKTGIPFEGYGDFIMSFDRINSFGGYTPGNVQAVCWMYNRAKGSNVDEAVLFMARALVARADMWD